MPWALHFKDLGPEKANVFSEVTHGEVAIERHNQKPGFLTLS